jgi:uncharacterized protein
VPLDAATLELLRSESGLSIDLEGRFLHRGEPITHARTLEVLHRSLERAPNGRYLVRIGREIGYVAVQDAPYAVRGVSLRDASATLHLSDGSLEALRPETLSVDGAGVLHCQVKGSHRARFTRSAQVSLGLSMEEDPMAPAGFSLLLGGVRHPLGSDPRDPA